MNTTYNLDADVIRESSKPRPQPQVMEILRSRPNLLLPAAALMEIQKGISAIANTNPLKAVRLSAWYVDLIDGKYPIVATDANFIEKWGALSSDPSLKNLTAYGQDIQIAAAALVCRAPIATFNVKDFMFINARYPLPGIYNPKEGIWYARMNPIEPMLPRRIRIPANDLVEGGEPTDHVFKMAY